MGWICLRCETLNADNDLSCEVCELDRLYSRDEVNAIRCSSEKVSPIHRTTTSGWYAFLALAIIAGAALLGIHTQLRQERLAKTYLRSELEGSAKERADLIVELKKERDLRQRISREWPISLNKLSVSSTPEDAHVPGTSASFYGSSVHYINFQATLINNQPEVQKAHGRLCIRYRRPSGSLILGSQSSQACSFWKIIDMAANFQISDGWGNQTIPIYTPGRYYIEFLWEGKPIGQTIFDVY